MATDSGIEWTTHTFNPWIGCTKVSPACDHCYAEAWDKRFEGGHWGPRAPRRLTSDQNWNKPLAWNKQAAASGIRPRVFCASLADVGDKEVPQEWRDRLGGLILSTPNLDWLLLTKRPQNMARFYSADVLAQSWVGTTVENQEEADRRIPHLLELPAAVRFLSCEPLLGPVDFGMLWFKDCPNAENMGMDQETGAYECCRKCDWSGKSYEVGIDWVIAGGESGPQFRPGNPDWFRSLRDQCQAAGVPFLFKQWEGKTQPEIKKLGREIDGVVWDQYPEGVAA